MVKACIVAATRAMNESGRHVPFFVQVTMEQTGTMLLGSELSAALNMIEAFPQVTAFGLNCATGPVEMAPHVRFLSQASTRPITVQPNAGLPVLENLKPVYKQGPEDMARAVPEALDAGVSIIGSCCGSTPEHTRAIRRVVDAFTKAH